MTRRSWLFAAIFLSACSSGPLHDFKRLEGSWISKNGNETFVESWNTLNDSVMSGTSYMTIGKDTVFREDLQLIAEKGGVFYIPTVPDQNDGEAVRFKLSSQTKDNWVFENKKHDFPNEIIYSFMENDSLIASVRGTQNGQIRKIDFRLHKN
jgi:hypothetical protein